MIKSVKKYNEKKWNRDTSSYDDAGLISYLLEYESGTKWTVPISEANTDYQEILKWVADGNTIEEAD